VTTRRSFLQLTIGLGGALAYHDLPHPERVDDELVDLLTERTRILRAGATEVVGPLIPFLERHCRLLCELIADAPPEYRQGLGRLAAETAWLAANAHSDNSDDQESLHWGATAARLARVAGDHDLRAHAVSRITRTYLSLGDADRALAATNRVDLARMSPFGRARIEVHRALAYARLPAEPHGARTRQALEALDAAHDVLLSDTDTPRPEWVWWFDDAAFLRSWEAEVLRSLVIPELAVPVFRSALIVAAEEDVRELPFLQAGLAEVVAQADDLAAAADEAIRAVVLARAVGADAALRRVRSVHRIIVERAPASRHARSLREALRS
jgi:hypothetical protein